MRLLGAKVVGVSTGSRTLKDAISEAMRDWVSNVDGTYYLLGSALGAHPYPMMVRDFQDRKSTRLNSSHLGISYAVFCLKKKKKNITDRAQDNKRYALINLTDTCQVC